MKFDMHCHTKGGSIDSSVSVERYIELLSAQGFDGMLITDHDSYKGYRKWLKSGKESKGGDFRVLAGIEYDTKDAGHFLVIMPDHLHLKILQVRGMPVDLLIHIVHTFGGILGPAHPFGNRSSSAMFFKKLKQHPEILHKVDFIEGFNTCEKKESNYAASELAEKLKKPCLGGSDAHDEAYVGMAYTLFDCDITSNNDLIKAIREGRLAGQVVQEAVGQGYWAAVMAFKAISGLEADSHIILTPEPLVTAANIDDEDVQAVLKLTYPASAGAY